jgi:hypothetical protein
MGEGSGRLFSKPDTKREDAAGEKEGAFSAQVVQPRPKAEEKTIFSVSKPDTKREEAAGEKEGALPVRVG